MHKHDSQRAAVAAAACPAGRLPQELIDQIIDQLYVDKESLKSCSLTCKSWLLRSSQLLFGSYTVRGRQGDIDLILTIQARSRISSNISSLTLDFTSFEHFGLIKALPHLRELNIDGHSLPHHHLAQVYTYMPTVKSTGKTIDLLFMRNCPVFLVEWLMQPFMSIGLLKLSGIEGAPFQPHCADHVVATLVLCLLPVAVLGYLLMILDFSAVHWLTLELPSRFDAAYASIVDKSVQALGEQIQVLR